MGIQLIAGAYEKLRKYQFSTIWQNNETKLNEKNMNEMRNLIQLAGDELFNNDSTTTLYHRLNRLQYETVGNTYTVSDGDTLKAEFDNNIGLLNRDEQLTRVLFNADVRADTNMGPEAPKKYTYGFDSANGYKGITKLTFTLPQYKTLSTAYNSYEEIGTHSATIEDWNGLFNGRFQETLEPEGAQDNSKGLISNIVRAVTQNNTHLNTQRSVYRPGAIIAKGSSGDTPLLMWKQNDDATYNFTHGDALLHTTVRMNYVPLNTDPYLVSNSTPYNSIVTYGHERDRTTFTDDKFVSAQNDGGPFIYQYAFNRNTLKAVKDVVDTGFTAVTAAINNRTSRYNGYFSCLADKELILSQPSMNLEIKNTSGNYTSGYVYVEVGAIPTVSYKFVCDAGKYKYNPGGYIPEEGRDTNVTFEDYSVSVSSNKGGSTSSDEAQDTLDWNSTLADGEIITFEGSVNHSDGCSAYNNLGQLKSDDDLIIKGAQLDSTRQIKAYRKVFYGATSVDVSATGALSSDFIRKLPSSTTAPTANGTSINITIPKDGTRSVVFAYPAYLNDLSKVLDNNAMNANIEANMVKTRVQVNGAIAGTEMEYKVYYIVHGGALEKNNTYTVII